MESDRERDEFRRIQLAVKVQREEALVARYHEHMTFYQRRLCVYHQLLGRIGERLGELEPEEPR